MRENESAEVAGVPEHVLDELAQTLADKLDILLDRLTDRALIVPDAGTAAWRAQWHNRDSDTGRELQARRLYIRAVLMRRAGIGLGSSPHRDTPAPAAAAATPRRRARTVPGRADANQLAIF